MSDTTYHPEDVKAELRKRHGTVGDFARARDIKPQAVADWLRGRTSAAVGEAVAAELGIPAIRIASRKSMDLDNSAALASAHRLNAERR